MRARGTSPHGRRLKPLRVDLRFPAWTVAKLIFDQDLSRGQVSVVLGREPARQRAVELFLALPDGTSFRFPAAIRRIRSRDGDNRHSVQLDLFPGSDADKQKAQKRLKVIAAAIADGVAQPT